MAFNEQEKQIILFGKQNGKSKAEVEEAIYRYRTGRPFSVPQQEPAQPTYAAQVQDAAATSIEKTKAGYSEALAAENPVQLVEGSAKMAAGAIETAASPLAPLFSPLGKVIGWVADKIGGSKTVQDFANSPAGEATSRIAEDVQNLSTIAGAVTGVKGAPQATRSVASSLSEVTQSLVSRSEADIDAAIVSNFERAVKPSVSGKNTPAQLTKYRENIVTGVNTIKANQAKLSFVDEAGENITGKTPETIQQLADALDQTKKSVFEQYDALAKQAGGQGLSIDTAPIASELNSVISNKALQLTNPRAIQYAKDMQQRYIDISKLDAVTAQEVIQNYNKSLEAFYRNPSYDSASQAAIDALIANRVRQALDEGITGLTGQEYQALKNQYGALKSIERDVMKAALREARKNTKGLIDFTDIFSGGQVVNGILNLNPAQIAQGLTQKAIAEFYTFLNSPNRAVKKMFEAAK